MGTAEALTDWFSGVRPMHAGWYPVKTAARKGDWFAHWNGAAWSAAYEDEHAMALGRISIQPRDMRYFMGLQRPFRGFKVQR